VIETRWHPSAAGTGHATAFCSFHRRKVKLKRVLDILIDPGCVPREDKGAGLHPPLPIGPSMIAAR
jgi:hypothetical protein